MPDGNQRLITRGVYRASSVGADLASPWGWSAAGSRRVGGRRWPACASDPRAHATTKMLQTSRIRRIAGALWSSCDRTAHRVGGRRHRCRSLFVPHAGRTCTTRRSRAPRPRSVEVFIYAL